VYAKGGGGRGVGRRVRELRKTIMEGGNAAAAKKELDDILGRECIKCGDIAIRSIDEPFITNAEDKSEWAL